MNSTQTTPRPVAITVICILGFIGTALAVPLVFTEAARAIGSWYPPYLGFTALAGFICMIGLWNMRKWGVFGYTALVALNQVVLVTMGVWNVFALLIPGIVIAIAFANLSKMR
jgi:hypothetical protein